MERDYKIHKNYDPYPCNCHIYVAINQGVDGLKNLRQMMEDGEDPNQLLKGGSKDSILVWAIRRGNIDAVRMLCQYGADIKRTRIIVSSRKRSSRFFY